MGKYQQIPFCSNKYSTRERAQVLHAEQTQQPPFGLKHPQFNRINFNLMANDTLIIVGAILGFVLVIVTMVILYVKRWCCFAVSNLLVQIFCHLPACSHSAERTCQSQWSKCPTITTRVGGRLKLTTRW